MKQLLSLILAAMFILAVSAAFAATGPPPPGIYFSKSPFATATSDPTEYSHLKAIPSCQTCAGGIIPNRSALYGDGINTELPYSLQQLSQQLTGDGGLQYSTVGGLEAKV